jgi:hypothetical protein
LGRCCEDNDAVALASERLFASAVARFAVQVEVGEGLSLREKRVAKLEKLRHAREVAVLPVRRQLSHPVLEKQTKCIPICMSGSSFIHIVDKSE